MWSGLVWLKESLAKVSPVFVEVFHMATNEHAGTENLPCWGSAFRMARAVRGYTQVEVAHLLEVSPRKLAEVELGYRDPTETEVLQVGEATQVPIEVIRRWARGEL